VPGKPNGMNKNKKLLIGLGIIGVIVLLFYVFKTQQSINITSTSSFTGKSNVYKLWIIADRDEFSKKGKEWMSTLWTGQLRFSDHRPKIAFQNQYPIKQRLVRETRGVELSELLLTDNKMITVCDRTGIVYEILNFDNQAKDSKKALIPRAILAGGNGNSEKPQKNEWAFERNGEIYIGSWGKEWTSPDGKVVVNRDPQYVKVLSKNFEILRHEDWSRKYEKLRQATGTTNPGYLVHEAIAYNPSNDRLYFTPRRVSKEAYNDEADLQRGGNILISCRFSDFGAMKVTEIKQKTEPTRGFSSLRFVPGHNNLLLALKTEENGEKQKSYITLFDTNGEVQVPEQYLGDEKFEGLEIKPVRE